MVSKGMLAFADILLQKKGKLYSSFDVA